MKSVALCLLLAVASTAFEIPVQRKVLKSPASQIHGIPVDIDTASKAYVGIVSLGTPGQDFNVAFDLRTPAFWVPDSACSCGDRCKDEKLCPQLCASHCCSKSFLADAPSGSCSNKNVFDSARSRSYVSDDGTATIPFLGDKVQAVTGYDTFRMGPHYRPGLSANNIQFGRVQNFSRLYQVVNYDGVFGLGHGEVNGLVSPIKQLAQHGVIPSALLTTYLFDGAPEDTVDGILTLGQVDRKRCHDVEKFVDIVKGSEWAFSSPSFNLTSINGVVDSSWIGVVDLTTDYMYLPRRAVNAIVQYYSASFDQDGRMLINCAFRGYLSFNIGGQILDMSTLVITEPHNGKICHLKVRNIGEKEKVDFRFGLPILKKHCLVLDYNGRIAFTQKKR